MRRVLWLCFTVSGAAALALEMLWMRSASLVLGQTAVTTSTVLACYFAGLGIGAASGRAVQRKAVIVYGLLELGVAGGALWSLVVFHLLRSDTPERWLAATGIAGRAAAVAVAILPATICLGATLPALGQVLARHSPGRRGGLLYGLNTLGGAAGIAAAGFGLPAAVGVRASYAIAAAASALAGAAALLCSGDETAAPTRRSAATAAAPSRARLRLLAAGAGAIGLGLEVLWTRLLAQVLHNSVYSFSAIALVFVLALALGAALAALLLRRLSPAAIAGGALACAALGTVAGAWIFVRGTDGLAYFGMERGLGEYLLRIVALAAVTAGPAALASGTVLPALWAEWGGSNGAARPLGDLASANTIGGVAGAVAAGFVAIPAIGVRASLLVAAVGYAVLADAAMGSRSRLRPLAWLALLIAVIADPMRMPLVHLRPGAESLQQTLEGASGIVTVVDDEGDLQMRLDNFYLLGGSQAAVNERRLGLVPLLLHPSPQRAAFIGLATGITASAAPALGVERTTVIEVVPEVAAAARSAFRPWNGGLLDRRDVDLVLDDGRHYLASRRDQFDVIVSDLFVPWHAGAGNLYSREMYETVRRRLAPGGLFCQWLPLYQLTREEFAMIAHTFQSVFPHTQLWRAGFFPNRPVVALVGQLSNRVVDLEQVSRRLDRMPAWARDPLLAAPRGLVMLYAGDLGGDLFAAAPLNTDDRPRLEFLAPRLTRVNAAGDKDWFTGEQLAAFYRELDSRDSGYEDPFAPSSEAITAARRAGTALYGYALAEARHDEPTAQRLEAEVSDLVPEVVASAEADDPLPSRREAGELADLRAEQQRLLQQLDTMQHRLEHLTRESEGSP